MLEAHIASLVFLDALISIESATFKLTWQLFWILEFPLTVLEAAQPTAIALIKITLYLVIFSITGAITKPNSDAFDDLSPDFLLWHNFFDNLAPVVPVVDHRRGWENVVREHFCVRPPSKSISHSCLKKLNRD